MDAQSLIVIAVAIILVYFFVKLVVSPIIKAILGIIIFALAIYALQRIFNLDLNQILTPLGIHLDFSKISNFNWILGPANHYIDQGKSFLEPIWKSASKSFNK